MSTHAPISPRLTLLRDFGDWLSPMVVKELRHGLRTRFFTMALIGFHWILILMMASVLIGASDEIVNSLFWMVAFFLLLGLLPLRGFSTLAGEARDGTLDMLTLTSISSWKITFGKWTALFSQNLLVGISLLPYLVARYQFGGVEIVREAVALGLLMLVSAVATAMQVGISSQKSIVLRLFLTAGMIVALFPAGILIYLIGIGDQGDSMIRQWTALGWLDQFMVCGVILLLAAYGVGFFLAMGASRIAPPSENHSTVKRVMMLGVVLLLTGGGVATCVWGDPDMTFWFFVPAMVITVLAGADLLTEETPRFPTVVLPFVRKGGWSRWSGVFLYPGRASGLRMYVLLTVMVLAMFAALVSAKSSVDWEDEGLVTILFLLAPVVPVVLPWGRDNRFSAWWYTQGCLVAAGILLMIFCEVSKLRALGFLGVITPTTAFFASEAAGYDMRDSVWAVGVGLGVLWLVAAVIRTLPEQREVAGLEDEALVMLAKKEGHGEPA